MSADLVGQRLTAAEAVIERGLATFVEVGAALMSIRDERLYRVEYGTFEDYCQERWGFNRHRAAQLIGAAEVVTNVTSLGAPVPVNEGQARELTGLPPETAAEVMQVAAESGKVTAATIRDARAKVTGLPQPTKPAEWTCHCGAHFKVEHTHCDTCGDHYPAGTHCPVHTITVDAESGEILDGPTIAGRAAADRAYIPSLPPIRKSASDHERDRIAQQNGWIARALKHLNGVQDAPIRARLVSEWDPSLCDDNPAPVNPHTMREIANGLLAFADEMETTRGLRVV